MIVGVPIVISKLPTFLTIDQIGAVLFKKDFDFTDFRFLPSSKK